MIEIIEVKHVSSLANYFISILEPRANSFAENYRLALVTHYALMKTN